MICQLLSSGRYNVEMGYPWNLLFRDAVWAIFQKCLFWTLGIVFVWLSVCAATHVLFVCLSLWYDLLNCYHSCVHYRQLIHMLSAAITKYDDYQQSHHSALSSHSKWNPLSTPLHILCHSNMTPPLSFIVPLFLLNSLPTCIQIKDSFLWPPVIFYPFLLSCPALSFLPFISSPLPSDRPPRAAPRPSPLWRVATIETGEPKWQPLSGPSPGASRISAQPILMHVFRNKLASLLKSLLWPMNIWCGQGCGVAGYNDRVLSYLARQRGSVPGPTQNTPPLSWDLEEPNPGHYKNIFSPFVHTFEV